MSIVDLDSCNSTHALYDNAFAFYKDTIKGLVRQQWHEEDITGISCTQYVTSQYYLAFMFVALIHQETEDGINTEWSYYEDTYSIDKKRKQFACNGIDLDDILSIFGLPLGVIDTNAGGIETQKIESTFKVEGDTIVSETNVLDIKFLLANPTECINLFDDVCQVPQASFDLILGADEGFLLSNDGTFLIIS